MKILHVINRLGAGGAQNLLLPLTKCLCEKGHEVTVLQLVRVSDDIISDKIQESGVKVITLREKGSLYNPTSIFKLARIIKLYDVVNVHLFPCFYYVAFAKIIGFCKTPLVYTEHSTYNKRMNKHFFRLIDNFVYRVCYSRIIPCANKVKEVLASVYPKVKNVCTINNGIDIGLYDNAEPYTSQELIGVAEDYFIITMVARFAYPKRQDVIIRALSYLPNTFHAVFVGSEEHDQGLIEAKNLANDLGVGNRTHFLFIRSDVPRILKSSNVIVISSEYEGLSLSLLEAMASSKPVIASDVQGLKEIVSGQGVLFRSGDDKQLSSILLRLQADKALCRSIAKRCRECVSEYDIKNVAERYEKVYKDVVGYTHQHED